MHKFIAVKLIFFAYLSTSLPLWSLPTLLGDLNEDGQASIDDIVILVNHLTGEQPLPTDMERFADVNQDGVINDADADVIAHSASGAESLKAPSPTPTVAGPNTTTEDAVNLTGTAQPGASIRIEGGTAQIVTGVDENGRYSANIPLKPNGLNRLFITGTNQDGIESPPNSFEVIQDSQPPSLFIDFPEDDAELTNETIVVAGRIGDRLSGFMGLEVKVVNTTAETVIEGYEPDNPQLANVIVGIGTNGTYERGNVPLLFGENIILVEAMDIHGNGITEEIIVHRVALTGRQMTSLSGDLQKAQVNTQLPDPLILQVTDSEGIPVLNKLVAFKVTRSDGRLFNTPDSSEPGKRMLQVRTDANGEAQAWWTMGSDAGCGNNRVAVTSRDISGTVFFCASADPAPARQINIGSGNNQRGEAGAPAPESLRAWVNDTCNGVANIPVTFTVVEGDGKVQGLTSITVETSITGHAEVDFTLGSEEGKNVVEATFPNNSGLPATFTLRGLERNPAESTSFSGIIHDNAMQPIGGAICTLTTSTGQSLAVASDSDGQFSFSDVGPGPAHLHVNGLEADSLNGEMIDKGSFPALAYDLVVIPNIENTLPTPVLLPKLNPANAQVYDGTQDVELTIEGLDDLKMIVKAGSMRRIDGSEPTPEDPATLSLNQVHFDEVPMPMPDGAAPPFAWTLQPAGVTFDPPVEVIYPNMTGLPEGAITYFLSFDHDTNKFEIVATGHVIEGGLCSVTDPGSGISKAGWGCQCPPYPPTGNHGNNNGQPKGTGDNSSASPTCCPYLRGSTGDPVDPSTGEFYETVEDLRIKGRGFDFSWTRTYRSRTGPNTAMGNGWDFSYNIFIEQLQDDIVFCDGSGRIDRYQPQSDDTWANNEYFRELRRNADETYTYEFEETSGWNYHPFDGSPQAGKIDNITDRNGNQMRFHYDSQGRMVRITDTLDRDIQISYNSNNFIASITDFANRTVRYEYYDGVEAGGGFGDLKSVTTPAVVGTPNGNDFPNGKTTSYTYSTGFSNDRLNHNLLTITDGRRNDPEDPTFGQGPYLVNEYTTITNSNHPHFDRVSRQIWGGDILDFNYSELTPSEANEFAVTKVIINDRNGNIKEYFYDVRNRAVIEREFTGRADPELPTTDTENRPSGKLRPDHDPDFFETRYEWNTNALQSRIIHPNGNITEFVYGIDLDPNADIRSRANLRIKRRLPGSHTPAGDQEIIEEMFEYDIDDFNACCGFNFVTKHTDGRGNVTMHQYDERGNRIRTQHRIPSIIEEWEYNDFGQLIKHTLPGNGSGHRRVNVFTYYTHEEDDDQEGYLKEEIIDFSDNPTSGFALTTTYEYDLVGNVIRKIDPRGHDTQYIVNELDQVVREISREVTEGSGIRYERDTYFDANNNVVRDDIININDQGIVEENSHYSTTFEYEILNHVIRKTEEIDSDQFIVEEYEYDGNRNREFTRFGEATNGNQPTNTLTQIYDERDLLYQEIRAEGDPDQSTMQYDYDSNRNRVRMHHGLEDTPRVTDHIYDSYDRHVETIDPMGNRMIYHYDENHNRISRRMEGELIDLEGNESNIRLSEVFTTYDEMDRLARKEVEFFETDTGDPIAGGQQDGKSITTTEYSDNSQVVRVVNDNNHEKTIVYDTANREHVVTDHKGNSTSFEYDSNSNVIRLTELEKSDLGNPDETYVTTNVYDGLDRLIQTIDNIGNTHDNAYDSRNNRTVIVDPLGNMVRHTFDGLNRLTKSTRFLTDSGNNVGANSRSRPFPDQPSNTTDTINTTQTWDDSSRLIGQGDDNGNITTSLYDPLNRKVKDIYADNTEHAFTYDVHDNKIKTLDANRSVTDCKFDLLDRQVRKDITVGPNVSETTTFEVFKYDGLSRLVYAEDDDSLVLRYHDSMNNVTREELWIGDITSIDPSGTHRSTYDGVGNELTCIYPSGRTVTCTFDELERKKTISETKNDQVINIAEYFYIGPQRVERRDYGNGTRLDIVYDGIDNAEEDFGVRQMIRTTHTKVEDGTIIDDRSYLWDPLYNKTQRADIRPDGPQLVHDYQYDSIYRLNHTTVSDNTQTVVRDTDYSLDGVGNRESVSGNLNPGNYVMSPTSPDPADFPMNQYTETPMDTREYDLNGNLTSISDVEDNNVGGASRRRNISYDYRNQMVQHEDTDTGMVSTYAYDSLGRRIQKSTIDDPPSTINYFYHSWQVLEEQNESGESQASYVYGLYIDEPLTMQRNDTNFFYHADQLYNVMAMTNSTGQVIEYYEYDDYGDPAFLDSQSQISNLKSQIMNPYLFTGRRFDQESGFYYYRTRFLDTTSGRFITRDLRGFDSLLSYFQFVSSNPLRYLDPFGKEGVTITAIILAGCAVATVIVTVVSLPEKCKPNTYEIYNSQKIDGYEYCESCPRRTKPKIVDCHIRMKCINTFGPWNKLVPEFNSCN